MEPARKGNMIAKSTTSRPAVFLGTAVSGLVIYCVTDFVNHFIHKRRLTKVSQERDHLSRIYTETYEKLKKRRDEMDQ